MKKSMIVLFGLLLAVGWTIGASAQKLPDKSLAAQYTDAVEMAQEQIAPTIESAESPAAHSHATTPANKANKSTAYRPSSRHNAPSRAGQDLNMKSLTLEEVNQLDLKYTWDNGDGQGTRESSAADWAKDPYQMYELLKYVYTCKDFPGPYYSAFTKNDERERPVYYGAVDGGWDITGPALANPTATFARPVTSSADVAFGTATHGYIPFAGLYQDYGYRAQMIYTESMLGIPANSTITSLTFYPGSNGINFSGSTVTLTLGKTTAENFGTTNNSNTSRISTAGMQVVATVTPTADENATTWTITFDQPFIYEGGNLLVDVYCVGYNHDGTTGSYANSAFDGENQTNYQSMYVTGSSSATPAETKTGNNNRFLPKATFEYTHNEEVTYDPSIQIGGLTITGNNNFAMIYSITITSGNTTVFSWDYVRDGDTNTNGHWPMGMNLSRWRYFSSDGVRTSLAFNTVVDGTDLVPITLDDWLFMGYSDVTVTINARSNSADNVASLIVNGEEKTFDTRTRTDFSWPISGTRYPYTKYDPDYYKPNEEGYTALIVAVKNTTINPPSQSLYDGSFFTTKEEIINYFANNVDSIKLLTDGLRIGDAADYSIGTVFNCDGTYNKFFFLGKGQAKQKPDIIINREIAMQHALGEYAPFKNMFEQFSPTTGGAGDEITDFYSMMNEGYVYDVVHDCRDVIRLGHQFSMSGNNGTTAYAMTGMNFFIPDYRLKYWENEYTNSRGTFTVDGRNTNPYQSVSPDGNPIQVHEEMFRDPVYYSFWYAWYNLQNPPKVGIYKITLEAVATPVAYDYTEGNLNYAVTLTWVSSLNEATGHDVPQIYTVYYWDPITGEKKYVEAVGITDGQTGLTTVTYLVEQFPTSYKIEYIVEGSPNDSDHPQFVAISNIDDVIIPGWNDFVGLELDHHESDFVVSDMANWYRNFLVVVNEDVANGLTIDQISNLENPMNEFKLYRFEYGENGERVNEKPIATVTFSNPTAEQVDYTITYDEINEQEQYKPADNVNKYDLDPAHLDVPLTGIVRIKGNGDIVIWPNGYHVNFKSIVIKNNDNVVASWNADNDDTLPPGWYMSSGSKWEEYVTTNTGDKVGYVEGGGYIYIPNMMNNSSYTNLTVEIVAYGDGAAVTRISVNDKSKLISNTPGITYTWGGTDTPLSPAAAPKRDRDNLNTNNNSNN